MRNEDPSAWDPLSNLEFYYLLEPTRTDRPTAKNHNWVLAQWDRRLQPQDVLNWTGCRFSTQPAHWWSIFKDSQSQPCHARSIEGPTSLGLSLKALGFELKWVLMTPLTFFCRPSTNACDCDFTTKSVEENEEHKDNASLVCHPKLTFASSQKRPRGP